MMELASGSLAKCPDSASVDCVACTGTVPGSADNYLLACTQGVRMI